MEPAKAVPPRQAVLWGATGQAKVLRECLAHTGVEVVAAVDNDPGVGPPFPGCLLLAGAAGLDAWLATLPDRPALGFLVAIGGSRGRDRVALHRDLSARGLTALTAIHPRAFVAVDAALGPGCQILAQAAVCVEARLGTACIVNTGATVDHECRLGEGVHVAPGAHLAGLVEVADFAMVGAGAVVLPRLRIGEGAVVGAGAIVVEDVPAGHTVAGNPARVLRAEVRR